MYTPVRYGKPGMWMVEVIPAPFAYPQRRYFLREEKARAYARRRGGTLWRGTRAGGWTFTA